MIEPVVFPDAEALRDAAAQWIVETAQRSMKDRGRFSFALTGGRTPLPVYRQLADDSRLDWRHTELLWTDERCVPSSDPLSNYGAAKRMLLDRVSVPKANVHRIRAERPAIEAADAYEVELRQLLGDDGRIDLVLLGMGADGHTASLFPRHQALAEANRWVLPVHTAAIPPWRVTMTLALINRARSILFMVAGSEKTAAVHALRVGEPLPALLVHPVDGALAFLLDRDAAGGPTGG